MTDAVLKVTEGSGAKVHTHTRSISPFGTVHNEVVIPGEQYLPSYIVSWKGESVATASDHLFQLKNEAFKRIRIRRIYVAQDGFATNGGSITIAVKRLVTAGANGTAYYPRPLNQDDAPGWGALSVALARTNPKGQEGEVLLRARMPLHDSADLWTHPGWLWEQGPTEKPIILNQGRAIALVLTNAVNPTGATSCGYIEWCETQW